MNAVDKIATTLGETETTPLATIERVIKVLGEEKALAILAETVKVEAEGGILTDDGARRRTIGGLYFKLVKDQITSRERGRIFGPPPNRKPKPEVKPITWEESQILSQQALQLSKGEATTVKLTIIGRPGRVIEKGEVVITSMQNTKAPSLPKGLPKPPPDPTTYVIYIVAKQWRKVKDSLDRNPDDKLIMEGYPRFDRRIGERGVMTIYAQSVTTKLIQQARREADRQA
ncbi:MAG: phosphorylated adapter RNA export RNA-binding domain-containing protein [Chloroflexota bacterium]